MRAVLLAFLVVTAATTVVLTTVWAATATFGLLRSSIMAVRGTGYWVTITQKSTGSTSAIRDTGSLSVV